MSDILDEKVGSEGELHVSLVDKKLVITLTHDSKGAEAKISVALKPEYFLAKVKAAIPGPIDDTVIDLLAAALLK
jgi:hypothetical protein